MKQQPTFEMTLAAWRKLQASRYSRPLLARMSTVLDLDRLDCGHQVRVSVLRAFQLWSDKLELDITGEYSFDSAVRQFGLEICRRLGAYSITADMLMLVARGVTEQIAVELLYQPRPATGDFVMCCLHEIDKCWRTPIGQPRSDAYSLVLLPLNDRIQQQQALQKWLTTTHRDTFAKYNKSTIGLLCRHIWQTTKILQQAKPPLAEWLLYDLPGLQQTGQQQMVDWWSDKLYDCPPLRSARLSFEEAVVNTLGELRTLILSELAHRELELQSNAPEYYCEIVAGIYSQYLQTMGSRVVTAELVPSSLLVVAATSTIAENRLPRLPKNDLVDMRHLGQRIGAWKRTTNCWLCSLHDRDGTDRLFAVTHSTAVATVTFQLVSSPNALTLATLLELYKDLANSRLLQLTLQVTPVVSLQAMSETALLLSDRNHSYVVPNLPGHEPYVVNPHHLAPLDNPQNTTAITILQAWSHEYLTRSLATAVSVGMEQLHGYAQQRRGQWVYFSTTDYETSQQHRLQFTAPYSWIYDNCVVGIGHDNKYFLVVLAVAGSDRSVSVGVTLRHNRVDQAEVLRINLPFDRDPTPYLQQAKQLVTDALKNPTAVCFVTGVTNFEQAARHRQTFELLGRVGLTANLSDIARIDRFGTVMTTAGGDADVIQKAVIAWWFSLKLSYRQYELENPFRWQTQAGEAWPPGPTYNGGSINYSAQNSLFQNSLFWSTSLTQIAEDGLPQLNGRRLTIQTHNSSDVAINKPQLYVTAADCSQLVMECNFLRSRLESLGLLHGISDPAVVPPEVVSLLRSGSLDKLLSQAQLYAAHAPTNTTVPLRRLHYVPEVPHG